MKDHILQLLREKGSAAAVEFAFASADALAATTALDELMRDLYWKQKDLAAAVAIGHAAAQHALSSAKAFVSSDQDVAAQLRSKAKTIFYNLASFTWRGWGEEGIVVTPADEAIGREAALANLRLAVELDKGDLPLSRARWMLGAQQLSARSYDDAAASFQKAAEHAHAAGEQGETLLAIAFERLARFLNHPDDRALFDSIAPVLAELAKVKDGEFFAQQVRKAMEIYAPEQ